MFEPPHLHEPTSERIGAEPVAPGDQLIYLLHLASYDFSVPYVSGRSVLDLGCGTGYGTARLAPHCASIVGVDVSPVAVSAAKAQFSSPNLDFRVIPPSEDEPLPFPEGSFDVVLSFQVIEHVEDPVRYLSEAKRVLTDGGTMLIATPDRTTRLHKGQRPWNRFHLREYTSSEFEEVVRTVFETVDLYGTGGPTETFDQELRRTARLRLATLPFTFPGCPEGWRQFGLGAMTRARAALARTGHTQRRTASAVDPDTGGAGSSPGSSSSNPGDSGIRIDRQVSPSVCIVAVAR